MRRLDHLPWHHHPAHPYVVVPVRIDPAGLRGPTPGAARGPSWRRLGGGWFAAAGSDPDDADQRIVEAAVALPPLGAVTGWADLHWRGARWFDGQTADGLPRPVPLAVGRANLRPSSRVLVSRQRLRPDEVEVVDGLRVTTAVRSVIFEMRRAGSVRAAVRIFDTAAYDDLVSLDEARAHTESHLGGCEGVALLEQAWPLVDENAWSPTEVDMRMVWRLDAGRPAPLTNCPLFDLAGVHLGTPDLVDPVTGVLGEYDGPTHLGTRRRAKDLAREADLRRVGLEPVVMVAPDRHDPRAFVRRLHDAYDRAASPGRPRLWTTVAPPWWTRTETVAQRRALPPGRQWLLAHRRRS